MSEQGHLPFVFRVPFCDEIFASEPGLMWLCNAHTCLSTSLVLRLQGKLLSALDATTVKSSHLAPRIIDAQLLGTVRQVDFIGFVSNPFYGASKPAGEATRQAAPMRNKRAKPKAPISDRQAGYARLGAAAAEIWFGPICSLAD